MPDQHGFDDNGTESARPRQSGQGDDQMNEYDSEIAHPGNGINTSQITALRPIGQFAIHRSINSTVLPTSLDAISRITILTLIRLIQELHPALNPRTLPRISRRHCSIISTNSIEFPSSKQ